TGRYSGWMDCFMVLSCRDEPARTSARSPAGRRDAGQLAAVSRLAETDPREPEPPQMSARPAVDRVAVAQTGRARIAREALQSALRQEPLGGRAGGVLDGPLQRRALRGVLGDHPAAPRVGRDLRGL